MMCTAMTNNNIHFFSLTDGFEVFESLLCLAVEHSPALRQQHEAVKLGVDGVAGLVNAVDDGAALTGQSAGKQHTVVMVKAFVINIYLKKRALLLLG